MKFLVACISLLAATASVHSYSSGAPESVCHDLVPQHPVAAQSSPAPYTITTSTKVVKAGQPMEVVITGKSASNTIRGFVLQARQGDKIVGKFTLAPGDRFAQPLNCGTPGNAVTHKKHDEKEDKRSIAFTWTPPVGFNDEIKFRATVAYNGAVFWVGLESAPVKVTN